MPSDSQRILCVDNEAELLEIRCAVLTSSGYNAQSAGVAEALDHIRNQVFQLLILSSYLSQNERSDIISALGSRETPILQLEQLTYPTELLRLVEQHLGPPTAGQDN